MNIKFGNADVIYCSLDWDAKLDKEGVLAVIFYMTGLQRHLQVHSKLSNNISTLGGRGNSVIY